jgi:hypothetical protein
MKSRSPPPDFRAGDLARLTQDMISFYDVYGPVDPGFLSGEPVLILDVHDGRATVQDSRCNRHSTSLRKLQHA